jgi:hypothetical protein
MAKYGPAKKLKVGWTKVGIDARGRRHFFLAKYPWHLEKHHYRHHAHYWEDTPGGRICQQVIHDKEHILPPNYDAVDPTDWTEAAMRRWFNQVIFEYETIQNGIYFFKNGDMYEGELNKEGLPNGSGIYTTKDGIKLKGTFKNGQFIIAP